MTKRTHILVVEDDPDTLEMLREAFVAANYAVTTASDGAHAAMKVRTAHFDAIVTDLKLPSMSGLQLTVTARESSLNAKTPVVVVSGYIDAGVVLRSRQLQVADLVAKPFDSADLLRRLDRHLGRNAARRPAYDARIINAFVSAVLEVFTVYFGTEVTIGKPVARTEAETLDGPSAEIEFAGGGFTGATALRCDAALVAELAQRVFPEKGLADAAVDCLRVGELCRRVVGRVRDELARVGVMIAVGEPRTHAARPAVGIRKLESPRLIVPVSARGGHCSIEMAMTGQLAPSQGEADEDEYKILFE